VNAPEAAPETSILIVDDNRTARQLLSRLLEPEGYRLLTARDGEEALRAIEAAPELSLVILDVMMPGVDGFEVCRRLRAAERESYLPIILATALNDQENIADGLAAGADDYVTKPFVQAEVVARVRAALRLKHAVDQLVDANQLAAVGAVAVTIGHEINNPLATVMGNIELALNHLEDDAKASRWLGAAYEEGCRIRDLVDRLLHVKKIVTTTYVGSVQMLDLDGSCDGSTDADEAEGRVPACGHASPAAGEQESSRADAAAWREPGACPSGEQKDAFDEEGALERLCGDSELLAAAAEIFLGDMPRMLAAIEAADGPALASAAHELKGAAANLSATALATAAAELEQAGRSGDTTESQSLCSALRRQADRLRPLLAELCRSTCT
jgi:DNA-binding response OmpR family regulator/HPt (histidine-containing phosphotransfer) domain-containing protein